MAFYRKINFEWFQIWNSYGYHLIFHNESCVLLSFLWMISAWISCDVFSLLNYWNKGELNISDVGLLENAKLFACDIDIFLTMNIPNWYLKWDSTLNLWKWNVISHKPLIQRSLILFLLLIIESNEPTIVIVLKRKCDSVVENKRILSRHSILWCSIG